MMDGSNNKNPSFIPTQNHYSSHHLLLPPSSSSSMPFSSNYFPSSTNLLDESGNGGDEDSGSGGFGGFGGKGKSPELDFDTHDCDSEEGIGEETTRRAPPRNGSGSKRTRAAEVHNLSEKRRRSRINEKMKALQNLIPNSNKTDKASMLDEAIEYLKQLQLQVQMLSMRNGLNLHPMYMPLQPSSQLNMDFAADHGSTVNMGVSMLPLSLDSSSRNSYGLSNQCESSHQPIILPNAATSMNTIGASFGIGLSHPHHGCFQLPVNDAIFREGIESNARIDSGNSTRNLQESTLEDTGGLRGGMIGGEMSGDVLTKDEDNRIFIQHLHGKH